MNVTVINVDATANVNGMTNHVKKMKLNDDQMQGRSCVCVGELQGQPSL
jgi:hypothetical protein